jgi:hypothetical protein
VMAAAARSIRGNAASALSPFWGSCRDTRINNQRD